MTDLIARVHPPASLRPNARRGLILDHILDAVSFATSRGGTSGLLDGTGSGNLGESCVVLCSACDGFRQDMDPAPSTGMLDWICWGLEVTRTDVGQRSCPALRDLSLWSVEIGRCRFADRETCSSFVHLARGWLAVACLVLQPWCQTGSCRDWN